MAITILDGSNVNVDIALGSVSYKCVANYWSADIVREFTEATTFCTTGWRSETPGLKQLIGHMDGFASTGFAGSDPLALFSSQTGVSFALTATTGCAFVGTCHMARDHTGIRAAQNSERAIDFRSKGAVSTAWTVS